MFQSTLEGQYNGIKPQRLSTDQSKILLNCIMAEQSEEGKAKVAELMEKDPPFLSAIVKARVENIPLPIKFTPAAYWCVNAFCDRPGSAVILLIDCLNRFEGKEVNVNDLITLYPFGFYDEASLTEHVDLLKDKKLKWAEIY